MSLDAGALVLRVQRVPRASGDEPLKRLGILPERVCSPRERG